MKAVVSAMNFTSARRRPSPMPSDPRAYLKCNEQVATAAQRTQTAIAGHEAAGSVVLTDTVVDCYEFLERALRQAGVVDYTEGFYHGDRTLSYEQAQHNQICYLLDQIGCLKGSRILDIGCGNGRLLDEVRRRGATGVGITISLPQTQFCTQQGLDVHRLDYRNIGENWNGSFDAVVANGSIEHFVQPEDALGGRADAIYREFFATCHRLIDPQSKKHKLITTTIHFGRVHIQPHEAMKSPWSFPWLSDRFHYALLVRGYGGYYPSIGQLERCAAHCFDLMRERDATLDYHLTSEHWLKHGKRSLFSLRQWARILPFMVRQPRYTARMLFTLLAAQSWNWQFRTQRPPMRHLWQTWEYIP
jgi:cyclopropane fatty-acyl-phospholipid synthase-like methyltransferase